MSRELELAKELVKYFEEKEESEKVELKTLNPGEIFKIGEHDFIVQKQDIKAMQTKVISKGFMAKGVVFDKDVKDYNKSSIRKLIETKIQPEIEKEVGADNIVEHEIDLTSVDMQNEFGSCKCKVRLLTFDEAREFNDLLVNEDLDNYWWTCTPWSTEKRGYKYSMAVVSPSGNIDYNGCHGSNGGVRPVCILKSNIFVSKGE